MALLAFELLLRLSWGLLLAVIFVRRTESSEKFVKIAARFAWGLGLTCLVLLYFSEGGLALMPGLSLGVLVIGFQLYTSVVATWGRLVGFVLVLACPVLLHWGEWDSLRFFLTSGLLMGGFFGGQFLGHWYLNVPGMHIVELKRIVNFLFAGLILKTLEGAYVLMSRSGLSGNRIDQMGREIGVDFNEADFLAQLNPDQTLFALEGDWFLGLGSYGVLLLSMRFLWGIFAAWILAVLIAKTVRMRSTQSATGILYAACVMVLVAEATALYLASVVGLKF